MTRLSILRRQRAALDTSPLSLGESHEGRARAIKFLDERIADYVARFDDESAPSDVTADRAHTPARSELFDEREATEQF